MPLVFRKIEKAKWYKTDAVPWLAAEDLQADALADLSTKGNVLSVYFVDEDDEEALDRLIAALALNREFITKLDYALFPEDSLSDIAIRVTNEEGDTSDPVVNTWHRHLTELSAEKIIHLADLIRNARKERVLGKRVRAMVVNALVTKRVDRAKFRLGSDTIAELENAIRAG
ncbi:hypothetical protein BH18ACI4_BH18ACI4_19670 [soil metagenome]